VEWGALGERAKPEEELKVLDFDFKTAISAVDVQATVC
jgi:hypothetical protein